MKANFLWRAPCIRRIENELITKAMLLGAVFEYTQVAQWDYDEAWVVRVDEETIIASARKVVCAIAFLEAKGVKL